jgi:hypothetical protein
MADYNLIVSLHDVLEDTNVFCTLIRKHNGSASEESTTKILVFTQKNNTQIFKMQIDNEWTEGEYKIHVYNTAIGNQPSSIKIDETLKIDFVYKQFVILIQSDKAIYKPGQIVLFRVVVLDDNLRPVNIKDIYDMKIYLIVSK